MQRIRKRSEKKTTDFPVNEMWISSIFLQLQHRCTAFFFSLLNSNTLRCLSFRIRSKKRDIRSKNEKRKFLLFSELNDAECQEIASIFTHLSNASLCNNQIIFNIPSDQFHYATLNSIAKRAQMSGVCALFWNPESGLNYWIGWMNLPI